MIGSHLATALPGYPCFCGLQMNVMDAGPATGLETGRLTEKSLAISRTFLSPYAHIWVTNRLMHIQTYENSEVPKSNTALLKQTKNENLNTNLSIASPSLPRVLPLTPTHHIPILQRCDSHTVSSSRWATAQPEDHPDSRKPGSTPEEPTTGRYVVYVGLVLLASYCTRKLLVNGGFI